MHKIHSDIYNNHVIMYFYEDGTIKNAKSRYYNSKFLEIVSFFKLIQLRMFLFFVLNVMQRVIHRCRGTFEKRILDLYRTNRHLIVTWSVCIEFHTETNTMLSTQVIMHNI